MSDIIACESAHCGSREAFDYVVLLISHLNIDIASCVTVGIYHQLCASGYH